MVFGTVLWGLWHLPLIPDPSLGTLGQLVVVHTAVGIPLTIGWRNSGNLLVPGAAHAVLDAIRNALLV